MGIQSFGEKFDLKKLIRARNLAREMTHELASLIRPGMNETDAQNLYKELSQKYGVQKQWHPPKLRFGPNTICNFKDVSIPYTLKKNDIFFLDIGPVIDDHEADYGETFYIGQNSEFQNIAEYSLDIFRKVSEHWRDTKSTGKELYQFAEKISTQTGFLFNPGQDGHRIGDFPHHIHFKGGLAECQEAVIENAWILEIHLWDREKKFGAFYEDLLNEI